MDEEAPQERQLNIHIEPEHMSGVYANFANITFSQYEFTITFMRIDHEGSESGDIPGVVVSRVNMSSRFMRELRSAYRDRPPVRPREVAALVERWLEAREDDGHPPRLPRVRAAPLFAPEMGRRR